MKKIIVWLFCVIFVLNLVGCQYQEQQPSDIEDSTSVDEHLEESNVPETPTSDSVTMMEQFETLGLTYDESKAAEEIFKKVGINEISNISWVRGSNVDGEQQFVCRLYDFNPNIDCIKVAFVLVKRNVQRISICYSPYGKLGEYPDSNKYEELKLLNGMTKDNKSSSITLYYKKLTNNEVDKNSNGYRAIYDYETHSITKLN